MEAGRGREENQRVSGSGGKIGGEGGKDAYRPRLEEEVVPRAALESVGHFLNFQNVLLLLPRQRAFGR